MPKYLATFVWFLVACPPLVLAAANNPVDRAYLAIDGDQLYYEVSGTGSPLVLVSGGSGMDLRQWAIIAPSLAENFQVIAWDPRGIGKSDNPTTRYSDYDDLEELLNHLGIERAGVIGLSSAGGLVLEFAVLKPNRVRGVVASAPFVPGYRFSQSMQARVDRFGQAAQQGREAFLSSMLDDEYFIPAPLDPSIRKNARQIMGENFDKRAGFDPLLTIAVEPPLIEQLSRITLPVLLVAGELDHPDVLLRNDFLADKIPSSDTLLVDQAGHNIPLENPDGFLDAIGPFLQRLR